MTFVLSDMQRIEDCPLDCNLAEIMPIQDLPGQFGACAQQCESGLLIRSFELQCPVQRSLTPKWDLFWVLGGPL